MSKLRKLRKSQGMAQQELAVKAGIGPASITMIERYGYCPGPDVRKRIADVLGTTELELWPELKGTEVE